MTCLTARKNLPQPFVNEILNFISPEMRSKSGLTEPRFRNLAYLRSYRRRREAG